MSEERDYLGELTAQERAEVLKHMRTLMQWQMYFLPGDCIQALRKVTELLCGRFPDIEIEVNSYGDRHHEYVTRLRENEEAQTENLQQRNAEELAHAAFSILEEQGLDAGVFSREFQSLSKPEQTN